eukprot:CAMPEP_0119037152 /NCGR_PEP_ID=MMETSP1177-20130426/5330_1 /TAXON_ID=2985 /ORGANISM="Ochromonas sp, Strain CCMP1899" /LENGTH=614 /DNA_ID=CAMNT_0006998017 /DNA_START=119 /DNA_END=1960 /DNA_ORIENTATION=-
MIRQIKRSSIDLPNIILRRWSSNVSNSDCGIRPVERGIKLKNSLFPTPATPLPTIILPEDNALTWYSCGPTVYDSAHIGHARTYVCTDIIRRILTDIHDKDVNFAIGVTDIDDKIIERAISKGYKNWPEMELMVRNLENEFFEDLDALNVRRPDAVLRVTEHMTEIIQYIEGINKSGCSYVTPDGVYFSVTSCGDSYEQFRKASTDTGSDDEAASEGTYKAASLGYKKDRRDFALWKTTKEGEPSWNSPWGPGRPGWHIECSAVTHSYFGPSMDIHSGGIDLQFPHHTNEIAQCAAHNSTIPSAWVKYWMHTGHLYIDGRKMSKSLKNFISIKDYLSGTYSLNPSMDFRIFCLQHKYNSSVYFSQDRIDDAGIFRRKIENYFKLSYAVISSFKEQQCEGVISAIPVKATVESRILRTSLSDCKKLVSAALVDDFDTPEALRHVSYLLGDAIKYANIAALNLSPSTKSSEDKDSEKNISQPLEPLLVVCLYVEDLLGRLGVDITQQRLGPSSDSNLDVAPVVPRHELVLDSLLAFRSKIRGASLNGMKKIKIESKKTISESVTDETATKASKESLADIAKSSLGEVLKECDRVRDTVGPMLGVKIEDISESVSIW